MVYGTGSSTYTSMFFVAVLKNCSLVHSVESQ